MLNHSDELFGFLYCTRGAGPFVPPHGTALTTCIEVSIYSISYETTFLKKKTNTAKLFFYFNNISKRINLLFHYTLALQHHRPISRKNW